MGLSVSENSGASATTAVTKDDWATFDTSPAAAAAPDRQTQQISDLFAMSSSPQQAAALSAVLLAPPRGSSRRCRAMLLAAVLHTLPQVAAAKGGSARPLQAPATSECAQPRRHLP